MQPNSGMLRLERLATHLEREPDHKLTMNSWSHCAIGKCIADGVFDRRDIIKSGFTFPNFAELVEFFELPEGKRIVLMRALSPNAYNRTMVPAGEVAAYVRKHLLPNPPKFRLMEAPRPVAVSA